MTAIHFHYSAFLVPIFAGMLGRYAKLRNVTIRFYHYIVFGVLSGPMLVAIGITVGGMLEFILVGLYVCILYLLAFVTIFVLWKGERIRLGQVLGILSSFFLLMTMSLSLLYSAGLAFGFTLLTIPNMVTFHGSGNAFGYGLLGCISWLLLRPQAVYNHYHFPVSRLRGTKKIGPGYVERHALLDAKKQTAGLVDAFSAYQRPSFQPEHVHPLIREFYEQTSHFYLTAETNWHKPFSFASFYYAVTKRIGQLHLEPARAAVRKQVMSGEIIPLKDKLDGRQQVRAWVRKDAETDEPIFTALYSDHVYNGERWMNIGLPLPYSVMTGVLRIENDQRDGLLLTSEQRRSGYGDEGIYLTILDWTFRLPISERFYLTVNNEEKLHAVHLLKVAGCRCLTISYELKRQSS